MEYFLLDQTRIGVKNTYLTRILSFEVVEHKVFKFIIIRSYKIMTFFFFKFNFFIPHGILNSNGTYISSPNLE